MKAQKFTAKSSREALTQIRAELGDDAVILGNRSVEGGVEILAVPSWELEAVTDHQVRTVTRADGRAHSRQVLANTQNTEDRKMAIASRAFRTHADDSQHVHPSSRSRERIGGLEAIMSAAEQSPVQHDVDTSSAVWADGVLNEVRAMRSQLAEQLGQLAWRDVRENEPAKAEFTRHMLSVGFSGKLTRQLLRLLPGVNTYRDLLAQTAQVLGRNIAHLDDESAFIEEGGAYALIGPTGVGKTTTTAKLAARCVVRHGAQNVAVITTDGYRIGGHEQIRIYAKLLGVPVISARDAVDLKLALRECGQKKVVLIDTVGMGQRDKAVAEQAATLAAVGAQIKRLLVLPATVSGYTLDETIAAYQTGGLEGVIITKLDEATTLGQLVDAVVRSKLRVYFMANGQRVPEDLHVAHGPYLVDKALRTRPARSAFELLDDDVALMMTGAPPADIPLVPVGVSA
jgi:flagellar biosynthesis protein FlhF